MLLDGKKGLIVGVANKRSIAWSIAEALHREGARLAFNYQGERLQENLRAPAPGPSRLIVERWHVTQDDELGTRHVRRQAQIGTRDVLGYCFAFDKREDLAAE